VQRAWFAGNPYLTLRPTPVRADGSRAAHHHVSLVEDLLVAGNQPVSVQRHRRAPPGLPSVRERVPTLYIHSES
jgi:hypothetical protein